MTRFGRGALCALVLMVASAFPALAWIEYQEVVVIESAGGGAGEGCFNKTTTRTYPNGHVDVLVEHFCI